MFKEDWPGENFYSDSRVKDSMGFWKWQGSSLEKARAGFSTLLTNCPGEALEDAKL